MIESDRTGHRVVPFPQIQANLAASLPQSGLNGDISNQIAATSARLNAAITDQRAAAQALRDAVGDLHGAMSTLARSLDIYSMQINIVAARVSVLRQQAITLESLAERVATMRSGGTPS